MTRHLENITPTFLRSSTVSLERKIIKEVKINFELELEMYLLFSGFNLGIGSCKPGTEIPILF
jgi:hypothetical protein